MRLSSDGRAPIKHVMTVAFTADLFHSKEVVAGSSPAGAFM